MPRRISDRAGEVFGRLTVIGRGPDRIRSDGRRRVQWWCSCTCGSEPVLLLDQSLKSEHTKSCGCLNQEERLARRPDRTGQRFGLLVALEKGPRRGVQPTWRCRCDCGKELTVQSGSLVNGHTRSCGTCLKRLLVGERGNAWKGDDIGYDAAHRRVRARFGPASEHRCVDCGGPAAQWTYDHSDIRELWELKALPNGREVRLPYSLDVHKYEPRCHLCHRRFDNAYIAFGKSL